MDQLDLLTLLPGTLGEVLVPTAVVRELVAGAPLRVGPLDRVPGYRVLAPTECSALALLRADLGAGEAEAIALALEYENSTVLLDDGPARSRARRMNLAVAGTVGVLIALKRAGAIGAIRPLIHQLRGQLQFRLSVAVEQAALREAGEAL